jgi:prepilin-type N-terminal cleavage/methylation domain-containing protein
VEGDPLSKGFSLVEVAVCSAVLGTAAVMLSAALATSNAQKHGARRQALARTLVIRQLEHIQARIDDSIKPGNTVDIDGSDPQLRLNDLRAANQRVIFEPITAASASEGPHMQVAPVRAIEQQVRHELPSTSPFHIRSVLSAQELDRLTAEAIRVRVFACAATVYSVGMEGARISPITGWNGNLHDLDLIMFQVVAEDADVPETRFFSLSRLCRVPNQFLFPPLDATGPKRGKF